MAPLADIPGQQLSDALGRMIRDPADDLAQIGLRIETIKLRGLDQRSMFPAAVGAGEDPVIPAQGNRAHGALGGVVIADFEASIRGEAVIAGQWDVV
jgi:hypothetical protein